MSLLMDAGTAEALAPTSFPPLVKALGDYFALRGTSAYLVGGVVRDAVLGRRTGDVDVVVDGESLHEAGALADHLGTRAVPLDEGRGIARVIAPGDGGPAAIDLTPLDGDIVADLARRDFAIDAMAVSMASIIDGTAPLQPIDPFGGLSDLAARVIRAVSPSVFEADPARLMRAPRLAAQLRFTIEDETARSIRRDARLLHNVAPERVRDEFLKLLAEPSAAASLRLLDDLGLLCEIIPELGDARGVTQPREHHWDVFGHSIEAVGQVERLLQVRSEAPELETVPRFEGMDSYFSREVGDARTRLTMLKLAALLHDIAKPETRTVEPSGRIRFLGHHKVGAERSRDILGRLRVSGRSIELVATMVEHHLRPSQMAQDGGLPTDRAVYRYFRDVGDAAIDTLYLNLADYLAARGPTLDRDDWSRHCGVVGHILAGGLRPGRPSDPPKLIDGHDLIREFSLEPGPVVGSLLEMVREAQAGGEISSALEAVEMVRDRLSSGGSRA